MQAPAPALDHRNCHFRTDHGDTRIASAPVQLAGAISRFAASRLTPALSRSSLGCGAPGPLDLHCTPPNAEVIYICSIRRRGSQRPHPRSLRSRERACPSSLPPLYELLPDSSLGPRACSRARQPADVRRTLERQRGASANVILPPRWSCATRPPTRSAASWSLRACPTMTPRSPYGR